MIRSCCDGLCNEGRDCPLNISKEDNWFMGFILCAFTMADLLFLMFMARWL